MFEKEFERIGNVFTDLIDIFLAFTISELPMF
jgi:hypothetical protein